LKTRKQPIQYPSAAGARPNGVHFDILNLFNIIFSGLARHQADHLLWVRSMGSLPNPLTPGGEPIPLLTNKDAVEIIYQVTKGLIKNDNGKYIAKNIGVSYATEKIVQILSGIPWYLNMRPQDLIENPWAANFVSLVVEETARQNVRSALQGAIDGQRPDEFTFLSLRWTA